jgi:hypothetical protein
VLAVQAALPRAPTAAEPAGLDATRFKYAKTAVTVLLLATAAVFLTIQFRESSRRMDDAQDTFPTIWFREENNGYTLGESSRKAIPLRAAGRHLAPSLRPG